MTTATKAMAPLESAPSRETQGSQGPRAERARKARLSEAHVLAAAIFRHYEATGELESAAWSTTPVNPPTSHLPVMSRLRADFQKALILDTARELGFPAASRSELRAAELGRICTALRPRMQELGIPEPEQSRSPERATADQYRRLYKVIDKVERLPGWGGRQHTLNFIHRQSGKRSLRALTRGQAEAIERGLDGVLRHSRTRTGQDDSRAPRDSGG